MTVELPKLTLDETIVETRRLLNHLETMVIHKTEDPTENLTDEVETLVALNSLKSQFRNVYTIYEQLIAQDLEEEYQVTLPGNVVVTRTTGARRKSWDHKGLGKVVADKIVQAAVDYDTGEVLLTPEEQIVRILTYAAPSYWRVKELKKIGVDPNKFSTTEPGKPGVKIERKG